MKKIGVLLVVLIFFFCCLVFPKSKKEYIFRPATFDAANLDISSKSDPHFEEARKILDQPFSYLGEGGQAYAFLSSDDRYVLKIFKKKHLRPKWYAAYLPGFSFLEAMKEKQHSKLLSSVIKAYDQAYFVDRQGCGLIYTHFDPNDTLGFTLELKDKLGHAHLVDLDETPFIIQEKAIPLSQVLKEHIKKQEYVSARKKIADVLSLYERHLEQGFYDQGIGVLHNNGFVGKKAIHLDVGRFAYDPEKQIDKDRKMLEIKNRIDEWVELHYPKKSS